MNKDKIINLLQGQQDRLRALGVEGLSLFGSYATDRNSPDSDIDLAIVYNENLVKDLFDMGGIAAAIETAIGTDNFDLAEEKRLQPEILQRYADEHVRIF